VIGIGRDSREDCLKEDLVNLWLVLPAIAKMIDEQNLSKCQAMSKLKQMLGPALSDPYVKEALARLQGISSGFDFRMALGTECLLAMEESHRLPEADCTEPLSLPTKTRTESDA
jgi:hypothetical protein